MLEYSVSQTPDEQFVITLLEGSYKGVVVKIDTNLTKEEFSIEKIYIDTTNMVLTENITNINKYEVIAKEIASVVGVELERIIVYG